VYLLPLVGGLLADRYLGTRKAIAFGACCWSPATG
jgi:POT family proton-dependent oligopeptide transporter